MLNNFKHWPVDHPNFQRGLYNAWDIVNRCDGSHFMGTLRRPRPVNYAVDNCGCRTHPCSCGSVRIPTAIPSRPKDSLEYLDAAKLSTNKATELVASLKKLGECKTDGCGSSEPTDCPTIEKLLGMGDTIYAIMSDNTVMEVPRSKLQLCDEKGLPTQVVTDAKKSDDSLLLTLTKLETGEESTVTFTAAVAPTVNNATESAAGIVRLATQQEAAAGTSTNTAITPATLANALVEKLKDYATKTAMNEAITKALASYTTTDGMNTAISNALKAFQPPKGLDCDAIKALSSSSWKDGMTLLAQTKEGTCVRLNSNGSVFKDVAVDYSTDKVSGNTGDTNFVLSARVTNNSTSPVEDVVLTLVNPAGEGYSVTNKSVSKSSNTFEVTGDNLVYRVASLGSGENFTVRQTVRVTEDGTYRFTSQVVSNAVDIIENNNSSSVAISAVSAIDPNYVATPDCPPITVTHDASKIQLNMLRAANYASNTGNHAYTGVGVNAQLFNIVPTDKGGLDGQSFILSGASSVVVYAYLARNIAEENSFSSITSAGWVMYDNVHTTIPGHGITVPSIDQMERTSLSTLDVYSNYTFDARTGRLTINAPDEPTRQVVAVVVLCRVGANCKWQGFNVRAAKKLTPYATRISNQGNAVVSKSVITELENVTSPSVIENPQDYAKWLKPRAEGSTTATRFLSIRTVRKVERTSLRLKAGTVYNITLEADIPLFNGYVVQGALKVTPAPNGQSVVISSTSALSTADRVNFPLLEITVEA